MLKLLLSLSTLFYFTSFAQSPDELVYLCRYDFKWQKDSTKRSSVFNDVMHLEIGKNTASYYSYFKQIGLKNGEDDMASNKPLSYAMQNGDRYYPNHESEIIINYYPEKKLKIMDRLSGQAYYYWDSLEVPVWEISSDTATILNQLCQKATTHFKGRNYTAWFANAIPYSLGPWQFSGLPGLILSVKDDKEQFVFECTQLAYKPATRPVYKEYPNASSIPGYKLRNLKKEKAENFLSFLKSNNPNLTITVTNASGATMPAKGKTGAYNPIDLSK